MPAKILLLTKWLIYQTPSLPFEEDGVKPEVQGMVHVSHV